MPKSTAVSAADRKKRRADEVWACSEGAAQNDPAAPEADACAVF